MGAFMEASAATGRSVGVVTTDSALWVAAADGGLLLGVLAAREGLGSCTLFFLDLPGPAVDRVDELDLGGGLLGDDSREVRGELAAEGFLLGWSFLMAEVVEVANDSRKGICNVDAGEKMEEPGGVVSSMGSTTASCGTGETGWWRRSSSMAVVAQNRV
jgi:hypothetical protein